MATFFGLFLWSHVKSDLVLGEFAEHLAGVDLRERLFFEALVVDVVGQQGLDLFVLGGEEAEAEALPGLRLGWLIAPEAIREELWARKDYTTIAPSPLSDRLAAAALEGSVRQELLKRGRRILRSNLAVLESWAAEHTDVLSFRPPLAGAIAFFRYDLPIGSTELAERLRSEQSVLTVPGDQFGLDGYIRIGYGHTSPPLEPGLRRLSTVLEELAAVPNP